MCPKQAIDIQGPRSIDTRHRAILIENLTIAIDHGYVWSGSKLVNSARECPGSKQIVGGHDHYNVALTGKNSFVNRVMRSGIARDAPANRVTPQDFVGSIGRTAVLHKQFLMQVVLGKKALDHFR